MQRASGDRRTRPETLHPRNRHRGGLDFKLLCGTTPALARYVAVNQWGNETIDFADPAAVKALNTALLARFYGVADWELPAGFLCPSIPGRADYLHHLADLLASSNGGVIPRGSGIRALDIGVGANCVYPLIGTHEYGWRFLGSEVDPAALAAAARTIGSNPGLRDRIELRLQASPRAILAGLALPRETFEVLLCNPPFHESPGAAEEGSRRKWRNLGKAGSKASPPTLNFGGRGAELWCPGGEKRFVRQLIDESAREPTRAFWFTSLLSKSAHLPAIRAALSQARVTESRVIEMVHGQKASRIVAWTFLDGHQREEWRARW